MRKSIAVGLALLLFALAASSHTSLNLTPRIYTSADGPVYLFDNETGLTQTTLIVVLGGGVVLEASDIIVFGGGEVSAIKLFAGGTLVALDVEVAPGGSVQITLAGSNSDGSINVAWFSASKS